MAQYAPVPKVEAPDESPAMTRPSSVIEGSWSFVRGDVYQVAVKYLEDRFPRGLGFHPSGWYVPTELTTWAPTSEKTLRRDIMSWLDRQFWRYKNGEEGKIPVEHHLVKEIATFLADMCAKEKPSHDRGVPLEDGFLDPSTRVTTLYKLDDFVTSVLPFKSNIISARPPERWLRFLSQGFRQQDTDLLQEWFGYCLEPGNHYKKVLWLFGDADTGKSIIPRVLIALLGGEKFAASRSAKDFSGEFNADLSGARLINFADYRPGRDEEKMRSFVLQVSGGDSYRIRDLYKSPWTEVLPGKILFTSNMGPQFKDTTKAFLSRLLTIERAGWHGPLDAGLSDAILAELPQILGWSLDGLTRLNTRGGFDLTMLDQRLRKYVGRQTNPVLAFAEDMLDVSDPMKFVKKSDLYEHWMIYAKSRGHFNTMTMETFMTPIYQAVKSMGGKLRADQSGWFLYGASIKASPKGPTEAKQ